MKNFLIIGLLALLLFSVSAALSLWLTQSKSDLAEKDKKPEPAAKPKADEPKAEVPAAPPKSPPAPPGGVEAKALDLRDQNDQLARRAAQIELVVRDLQTQREATEASLRQVMNELKNVSAETGKLDLLASDLQKKKVEFEAGEKKNIEKIAGMYDAMAPEAAGPMLKQMADNGQLELAAKIVSQMKDTKAARALEAMNDPSLAIQILEKIRGLRAKPAAPPAPAPAPVAAPVVPAKGP